MKILEFLIFVLFVAGLGFWSLGVELWPFFDVARKLELVETFKKGSVKAQEFALTGIGLMVSAVFFKLSLMN